MNGTFHLSFIQRNFESAIICLCENSFLMQFRTNENNKSKIQIWFWLNCRVQTIELYWRTSNQTERLFTSYWILKWFSVCIWVPHVVVAWVRVLFFTFHSVSTQRKLSENAKTELERRSQCDVSVFWHFTEFASKTRFVNTWRRRCWVVESVLFSFTIQFF